MFIQLNDPAKFGGTGVGLAIVKKSMQIMHGNVGVESTEDSGQPVLARIAQAVIRLSKRDAALLLFGHGSTLNADSSAPTYQHAEEIRRNDEFAEVHVGFWKEEPNFRQALHQTSLHRVYVVPNFISSGYFTEQIIPRELGLPRPITRIGAQEIYYCQPVGLSDAMTDVLLQRAYEVVAASAESCDLKQTCLFICGHGTSLNDNSTKIIHKQAEDHSRAQFLRRLSGRAHGTAALCEGLAHADDMPQRHRRALLHLRRPAFL